MVHGVEEPVVQVERHLMVIAERDVLIDVEVVKVNRVHTEEGDLQTALSGTQHDFSIGTVLCRTDQLIYARTVLLDEVCAHSLCIGIEPDIFHHHSQCLRLIYVCRNHIIGVIGFLIVVAINEIDVILIGKVGLQPLVELIASRRRRVEDTLRTQVIVGASCEKCTYEEQCDNLLEFHNQNIL